MEIKTKKEAHGPRRLAQLSEIATANIQILYNIFFSTLSLQVIKWSSLSGDLNAFCVIKPYVNLRGQGLPPGDPWLVSLKASYHHGKQYIWFRGRDLNGS